MAIRITPVANTLTRDTTKNTHSGVVSFVLSHDYGILHVSQIDDENKSGTHRPEGKWKEDSGNNRKPAGALRVTLLYEGHSRRYHRLVIR